MNLVAVMSNALEMLEEANEQMFKGDCRMAQRLRNWVVFLHGHDGEFSFMVNHGLLMRTEAPFFGVSDRTFKRWKKDSQTDCTFHDAQSTLRRNRVRQFKKILEQLCGRLLHQR